MNYGRIQNRRPEKGSKSMTPGMSMKKMAKQMGVDPAQLGGEAESLWNMLEDLSANDPAAYRDFIQKQLKDGPPTSANEKSFTPKPSFVVKCVTETNHKLFINMTEHAAVESPKHSSASIPLAIGPLRSIKDKKNTTCRVVDVVFNPEILFKCSTNTKFQADLIELAVVEVEKEFPSTTPKIKRPAKVIKSLYKGGNEDIESKTISAVPFVIKEEMAKMKSGKASNTTQSIQDESVKPNEVPKNPAGDNNIQLSKCMDDPLSLLKELSLPQAEVNNFESSTIGERKTKKHAPLIQEVVIPKKSVRKTRASSLKKGFLNKHASLYPEGGSSEGHGASAYVKLLSRSHVIDTAGKSAPSTVGAAPNEKKVKPDVPSSAEDDHGDFEFNQLCAELEPELSNSRGASNAAAIDGTLAMKMMEKMLV